MLSAGILDSMMPPIIEIHSTTIGVYFFEGLPTEFREKHLVFHRTPPSLPLCFEYRGRKFPEPFLNALVNRCSEFG